MIIEQHGPIPAENYDTGRFDPQTGVAEPIDRIVLHTMVGWIASADARFKNASSVVSAHYGVRVDGTVWQWVDERDTAFHAGLYYENLRSVGIEHEDEGLYNAARPDVLYGASAMLVAQLCTKYGIPCVRGSGGPGIYDHRDIIKSFGSGTATACPDALDTDRIIRQAAAIVGTTPAIPDFTIRAAPRITPATFAHVLDTYGSPALPDAGACFAAITARGVDPAIALAFFAHESGCGTKFNAAPPGIRWGNIRWRDSYPSQLPYPITNGGGYVTYRTYAEAADHFARHITGTDGTVVYAGLQTVSQVVPVWAPTADGNTPDAYIHDVNLKVFTWQANPTPEDPVTDDEFKAQFARVIGPALEAEIQQRKQEAIDAAVAKVAQKLAS